MHFIEYIILIIPESQTPRKRAFKCDGLHVITCRCRGLNDITKNQQLTIREQQVLVNSRGTKLYIHINKPTVESIHNGNWKVYDTHACPRANGDHTFLYIVTRTKNTK